jgi:hypothetical protein
VVGTDAGRSDAPALLGLSGLCRTHDVPDALHR